MTTRAEVVGALAAQLERLERVVAGLDAEDAARRLPGSEWTVRDALCHLTTYYDEADVPREFDRLRRLAGREPSTPRPASTFDVDAANEQRIRALDGVALQDVVEAIRRGRRTIMAAVEQLDEAFLAVPIVGSPWGDITVAEMIVRSTSEHDREHLDEVEAALAGRA